MTATTTTVALRRRAARLGMRYWPYGVDTPEAQRQMLDWAERRGLRYAPRGRCLCWLIRGQCGGLCRPHEWWIDHVTGWTRDGRPAVLVSQPYGLGEGELARLHEVAAMKDVEVKVHGSGWYGHGSVTIEVWRVPELGQVLATEAPALSLRKPYAIL